MPALFSSSKLFHKSKAIILIEFVNLSRITTDLLSFSSPSSDKSAINFLPFSIHEFIWFFSESSKTQSSLTLIFSRFSEILPSSRYISSDFQCILVPFTWKISVKYLLTSEELITLAMSKNISARILSAFFLRSWIRSSLVDISS